MNVLFTILGVAVSAAGFLVAADYGSSHLSIIISALGGFLWGWFGAAWLVDGP